MSPFVRRLLVAAMLLGMVVGGIVALAVPRTRAEESTLAPGVVPSPAGVVRTAPAIHLGGPTSIELRPLGPVRIEARAADPDGGPDWVVRVFPATRVVARRAQRPGVPRTVGRNLCAQLGREYRGRFGWLDARGTFRPVPIALTGSPISCGSRKAVRGRSADFDVRTTITDPDAPAAEPKTTVAWGLAGRGARTIAVRLGTTSLSGPRRSPNGAWLLVTRGLVAKGRVRGRMVYSGRTVTIPSDRRGTRRRGPFVWPGAQDYERPAARAPDPNGGLPFGIGTDHRRGNIVCTRSGGRIVGGVMAGVDYDLDTMGAGNIMGSCTLLRSRSRQRFPVELGYGGLGGFPWQVPGDDRAVRGRIQRRTQVGTMIFSGTVTPDVEAVTFVTPRDVRTIRPTNGAVITVYDGSFPAGEVMLIARMKDGRTRTMKLPQSPV